MSRLRLSTLYILLGSWLLMPSAGLGESPNPEPMPELQRLLDSLDNIRRHEGVPSVALTLVSSDGPIWTGALGVRDVESDQPARADTLYRIGSITKSFTALALLIVQERGLLSLNTPLKRLAPDAPLDNPWAGERPITIAQLLEHSAGLSGLTQVEFDHSDPSPLTLREALQVAPDARRVHWPPGLHFSYTNAGAGLAAFALEQVSGESYEDFVEQELFGPLAMHHAGFFLDTETRARLATGYDYDGRTPIPYWHMIFRPFGGINATPREMGRFVVMLLNRGRLPDGRVLLKASSIARMERPETTLAARTGLRYGYGLGNYTWIHNGFVFHGHGGDGDGYLSRYGYNRELDRGYFLTINAFRNASFDKLRERVEDYLTRGQTPPRPPPAIRLDPGLLQLLTGRYRQVTWRFPAQLTESEQEADLHVLLEGSQLHTRFDGQPMRRLIAVDSRRFRRQDQPVATLAFGCFRDKLYLQGELGNYRRIEKNNTETCESP